MDDEKEENDRKMPAIRERKEFLNHQLELEQKRKNDKYIEKEKLKLLKEKYDLKRKENDNDFKEKMNQ